MIWPAFDDADLEGGDIGGKYWHTCRSTEALTGRSFAGRLSWGCGQMRWRGDRLSRSL